MDKINSRKDPMNESLTFFLVISIHNWHRSFTNSAGAAAEFKKFPSQLRIVNFEYQQSRNTIVTVFNLCKNWNYLLKFPLFLILPHVFETNRCLGDIVESFDGISQWHHGDDWKSTYKWVILLLNFGYFQQEYFWF